MTDEVRTTASETDSATPPESYGPARDLWLGTVVATLIAVPLGTVLGLAALLPFFLGLFFFVLFGLMIGAIVFRFSAHSKPHRPSTVLITTTLLVFVCWATSIWLEARLFPGQMGEEALSQIRHPEGDTPELRTAFVNGVRDKVTNGVRTFLAEEYAPGGTIGYMRWCMDSSVIKAEDIDGLTRNVESKQGRIGWSIRVAMSIGLLAFGIGSQTFSLKPRRDDDEESDEEGDGDEHEDDS